MKHSVQIACLGLLWTGMILRAQIPGDHGPGPEAMGPPSPNHGPMGRGMRGIPLGPLWTDPALMQKLGITADQQKKIDDLVQQSRLKLIDLSATLQKEETILEPLLAEDRPDEAKVLSQIDRVAQSRAELEKAKARMLLGIRSVLTLDQWKKLQWEGRTPPQPWRQSPFHDKDKPH